MTRHAGVPDSSGEPSLYGFRVRCAELLRFLRVGGGVEPLEIVAVREPVTRPNVEPLGDWPLQGTSYPARATLYKVRGGYEYWTTDAGRYFVDLDHGRIEIPGEGDELLREQRLNGMPMILSFGHRGDVSLHAAAVEVGAGAVILAAPSLHGKTTLAFAFHQQGHRLLSEDLVCCRPSTAEAIPGPALVRLRPDVYDGTLPEGMHVAATRPDRIYVALDPDRRGSSAPVPITGIVFLRESDELRIEPVLAAQALKDLWHLSFRPGTTEGRADSFRQLTRLVGAIPVWNVHRPLQMSGLGGTVALIRERMES